MSIERPNLSVCVDNFRLEFKTALDRARTLRFRAIDIGATRGPIAPDQLSRTGQRHFLRHLSDLELRLGSLRGPTSGPGYADPNGGERRLEMMRKIITLASALHTSVVSTTLGPFGMRHGAIGDNRAATVRERKPDRAATVRERSSTGAQEAGAQEPLPHGRGSEPTTPAAFDKTIDALEILADDADRCGVIVAIDTAGISAGDLNRILAQIGCPNLLAAYDTGAMLMQGEDPHRIADYLAGRIGLVRARDAIPGSSSATGSISTPGYEVALGDGALDVPRFLAALAESAFADDIVLTRTTGDSPEADLRRAKARFEDYLEKIG